MSFSGIEGKARYAGTAIERILPVQIATVDDRVELPQRRQPEVAKRHFPGPQELRVRGTDPQLDAAALASGGGDRRVGVRHQLGDDLREIDPRLREVLAKVAPANPTVAQLRDVDRHG